MHARRAAGEQIAALRQRVIDADLEHGRFIAVGGMQPVAQVIRDARAARPAMRSIC